MRTTNLRPEQYFGIFAIILLLYDITVLLNIPFLRPMMGFVYFSTVPGLLILYALKINNIAVLKKLFLAVGLSITFLIFGGLFINTLHPYLARPLSTINILVFFNITIFILLFISYITNKHNRDLKIFLNFKTDSKKLISPLMLSLLFPFISIFGTHLMNTQEINIVLMFMLILIPIYIVVIFYMDSQIPEITYPLSIIMIGISLHLMHSLTSNYLIGRDIHIEYYISRLTANNMLWNVSSYQHAYSACLSIAVLPPIYGLLLGTDVLYVFKIIFPVLGALIPAICYVIFSKYVEKKYAMLASFFFMSQVPFIYDLQSATRTEIALIFFALAILVFFDNEINIMNKRILFLIFAFSIVVSHYSTSYLFFAIVSIMFLCENFFSRFYGKNKENVHLVSTGTILLLFMVIFFWYSQITFTPFDNLLDFLQKTFVHLGNLFVNEVRAQSATAIIGVGVSGVSRWIVMIVQDLIIVFITIGLFDTIAKYKGTKYHLGYISIMLISWVIMASMFVLPFVSTGYGVYRTYQMGLITLAPMLHRGVVTSFKHINVKHFSSLFFMSILVLQFFCATHVVDQLFGNPNCIELNREGFKHEDYYIYDSEVSGSKWINNYGKMNSTIWTDARGYTRVLTSFEKMPPINSYFFNRTVTVKSGYIYLRYSNMVNDKVFPTNNYSDVRNLSDYEPLLYYKNSVYNNGGCEVYA